MSKDFFDLIDELDQELKVPARVMERTVAHLIEDVKTLEKEVKALKKDAEINSQLLGLLGQQEAIRLAQRDLKFCENKEEFIANMKKRGEELYDGEYAKGYADFIDEIYSVAERYE